MLWTEVSVFLFQKVNIHIHVIFQFISHIHIKSELSLHYEQNPTTVSYKETYDYSSFSYIIITKDHFNIILPYFSGAHISYFHLMYSVLYAISFD